ncbi:alpha/beta fold hydrolase [Larkinella rosea]|uniref:Alpha/beta hydrolase n=1 Tax=Larkinella rosea TaxID=2025312 RepID=A0A3P1BDH1_9BACT|nr:alpha/beta hydrolase [Larkinella rosea]RRA98822.1 alpha/beta hydrolase [Larkinella rosea]
MKTALLVCLLFISLPVFCQEKLVDVNGHQFHVYVKGFENRKPNDPVLIFENGLGMGLGNWNTVIDELAKTTPVFAYDRAGVEKSEKVYQTPTVQVVAENLKAILKTLKISPPYILVGHSMGGIYTRGFAGFYPDDMAGLVFIDPADFTETKDDWNAIFRRIGVPEKKIDEMLYDRLYKTVPVDSARFGPSSELRYLTALRRTDFAEITRLPVPNVPIYFFIGGKFEVPADRRSSDYNHDAFFEVRTNVNIERWKKFIYLSSKGGALIYLSNSGHYLHRDDADFVIGTLKMMLKRSE